MLMLTAHWSSSRPLARKSGPGGGRCGRSTFTAQSPAPLDGVVSGAGCLGLLEAASELGGEQVDRGVHVLCGRLRVDVVAAHFFFSSRRRHTRSLRDWSSDVCSSDLKREALWKDR